MEPAVIVAIISVALVAFTLIIAYQQWRENHSDRIEGKLGSRIKAIVQTETDPIRTSVIDHTIRLTQAGDRLNRMEELLKEIGTFQRELADSQAKMGVKVDVYWTSIAMNAAKGLHQPDPLRAHIDQLLESFMEGTLTDSERTELKKLLIKIRNFEPSRDPAENYDRAVRQLGFPVFAGEQTHATILLSTMDLVNPRQLAAMGHAEHRAYSEQNDNA